MKKGDKRPWAQCVALALLSALLSVAAASSGQSRLGFGDSKWANGDGPWKGTFTLPFQVRWGGATLPPGDYTYSINSGGALRRMITIYGGATNVAIPTQTPVSRCDSEHMSLFVANVAGMRRVYMLHLADVVFSFAGGAAVEKASAGDPGQPECSHLLCCRTAATTSNNQHAGLTERVPVSAAGK